MHTPLVITFIADDRPGLIERVSQVIGDHGGNWLESRMSHLAGKFAGIVCASVPSAQVQATRAALQALEAMGLTLTVETARAAPAANALAPWRLEIVGHDRPGIVREFASALARRDINVFDMRSDITSAPMTGQPLFVAGAVIHVPAAIDIDDLRAQLEAIADELMIEYTLEQVHPTP